MNFQSIANIASICSLKGVQNVILSPGSRCAPLTLAFVRHPDIITKTISDERSAAFIGLGIALKTKQPVALVCTSGSATLNYAAAIAEAYFQQVPLIVFTADRPPEWIDQLDGQTIRQSEIYGNHVKRSFELPVDSDHADAQWHVERIISEAINESTSYPPGPVHINAPFREPFYPDENSVEFHKDLKTINQVSPNFEIDEKEMVDLLSRLNSSSKILMVVGQQSLNKDMVDMLEKVSTKYGVPIVADIISNLHQVESLIKHQDLFLADNSEKDISLKSDLLITFGKSIISKNLKLFLRKNTPSEHWHLQEAGYVADTYQSLSKIINASPISFFTSWLKNGEARKDNSYKNQWVDSDKKVVNSISATIGKDDFSELEAVAIILDRLLNNSDLHLANSMSVRYANLLGLKEQQSVEVFANRGTSGIDGCTSTALGTALSTDRITTLITGDMAFFYDRNALWNNYLPSNLRIIVLNNHGGVIFGLIEGPNKQPELEEYFETRQALNARLTAEEFGLEYTNCKSKNELISALKEYFEESKVGKILEIEIDKEITKEVFAKFKKKITDL